jgi:uncharacterized repeat protein (TIGR01451 family)
VAALDFTNDTATPLVGTSAVVFGVDSGYDAGDLAVFADQWHGGVNDAEFEATGSQIGDSVVVLADVSVTKTDGVTSADPGGTVTYTIVAANAGPFADPAVAVADNFPAELTCTYTSVAAGGATGNTASGSGDIADTLSMPSGSSVTYTAGCTISVTATGTLSNTATVTGSLTDPTPGNDSATDDDTVINSLPQITTCPAVMSLDPLGFGIAAQEAATGDGYLLWSSTSVHTRFVPAPTNASNADHLIAVKYVSGQWMYDNNNVYTAFTPASDDCLVAALDFTNDTATVLVGTSAVIFGIDTGYDAGDLAVFANMWNSVFNDGEFQATGTVIGD